MTLIFWIVPVISILMNGITYLIALGIKVNISAAVSILMGTLFILLGNYLPKLRQNYTIGIKLPWTLCSEENWCRTHRLGGKLFIIGGILVALDGVAGIWLGDTFIFTTMIGILLICVAISVGYSFWLFKKEYDSHVHTVVVFITDMTECNGQGKNISWRIWWTKWT